MKRAKILILNLNPSDRLGDDLRCIVESQFEVEEVKIWEKIGTNSAATECGEKLAQVVRLSNPSVIFVVQSADRLKHTRCLFLSCGIKVLTIPLLVVVDEAEPDEMIEWIRELAADFLTKPLKKIDVLPRLWRLLDQSSESETAVIAGQGRVGNETIGRRERDVSYRNQKASTRCEMRCQRPDQWRDRNRQRVMCSSHSLS